LAVVLVALVLLKTEVQVDLVVAAALLLVRLVLVDLVQQVKETLAAIVK
jgi:hypothetical protein